MALLAFAALLAAAGTYVTIMAMRFRQGRAEHLRHQPYQMSLWPAARRNIAYGLLPIAGILFLTAASMAAQIAGVRGPLASWSSSWSRGPGGWDRPTRRGVVRAARPPGWTRTTSRRGRSPR